MFSELSIWLQMELPEEEMPTFQHVVRTCIILKQWFYTVPFANVLLMPLYLFIYLFIFYLSFSWFTMEATTKYDYRAKVDEELSFRKGQHLKVKYHHMLYNQIVMGNLTGHLYNFFDYWLFDLCFVRFVQQVIKKCLVKLHPEAQVQVHFLFLHSHYNEILMSFRAYWLTCGKIIKKSK